MNGKIALKQVVDRVIKEMMPLSMSRRCGIINDISFETHIEADEEKLSDVLVKLLAGTIKSSHNSCIHISAEKEDEKTFITVKDNNSDYSGYISGKMTKVEPLIQNMGGNVYFEFNERNSITIVLCLHHSINVA
jgi:light-regulated signal transduction histidine kinase (bacteriophytochrome)